MVKHAWNMFRICVSTLSMVYFMKSKYRSNIPDENFYIRYTVDSENLYEMYNVSLIFVYID